MWKASDVTDMAGKFQYSFDGGVLTDVATNIPTATTNLFGYSMMRTLESGVVENNDLWYWSGYADK